MKYFSFLFIAMALSAYVFAESGDFGVEVDVTTTGLFPPKPETVTVATVQPNSSAAKNGIKPGDKVVSIDGCAIPGCSAWQARKKMSKNPGESAVFEIINEKGQLISVTLVAE